MTQPPVISLNDINNGFTYHRGYLLKEDYLRSFDDPDFKMSTFFADNTINSRIFINIIKGSQISQNTIRHFNYIINPEQKYLVFQHDAMSLDLSKPIIKIFRLPKDRDVPIPDNLIIDSRAQKMSGGFYTKYQKYVEKFKLKF